jgi:ATP phosphoribosyltransferase regulatory subunit
MWGTATIAGETRETFLAPFVAAGYVPVEPAILQPAELFLDLSGEELGKRLYLTSDGDGQELCLRPELTIPVCRDHVAAGDPARLGAYCYFGPAFRHRPGRSGEFLQAGVESIGRADTAAADAEVFALALDCVTRHGLTHPTLRLGDTGLFRAVLAALELPAAWQRRLARDFGRADLVTADLASLTSLKHSPAESYGGVLAALSGADRAAARALVEDLLRIGGLATVGGRSVTEIADRFMEQAGLADAARVSLDGLDLLRRLLEISAPLPHAIERIVTVTAPLDRNVREAVAALSERAAALEAAGIPVADVTFEASFGRRLDYYTGVVFEILDPTGDTDRPVAGGGRYDGLLTYLGAAGPVPAVGFSVWPERLPGGGP